MPWWAWFLTIIAICMLLFSLFWILVAVGVFKTIKKVTTTEKFDDGRPKLKIVLFYAVWCPHCEQYLDSNVFMKTFDNIKRNTKYDGVVFEQLDYDKNKDFANKLGVRAFPSIVAVTKEDKLINEFQGDRFNSSDLERFAAQSLAKI